MSRSAPKSSVPSRSRERLGRALTCILVGLLLFPGCASSKGDWAFAITRGAWGSGPPIEDLEPIPEGRSGGAHADYYDSVPFEARNGSADFAVVFAVLILLPIAIDVALLPVTLTHDLVVDAD